MPVNLDKREYIDPHKLGCGLKLWEHLANHPGTGAALIILCAAMPEPRGGGDFDIDDEKGFVGDLKKGAGVSYSKIAKRTIGRWAGDRIAFIGDYAELGDLPREEDDANIIYDLCWCSEKDKANRISSLLQSGGPENIDKAERLKKATLYLDITLDVCAVIEHELQGKFVGNGWREWKYSDYDVKMIRKRK